MTTIREIKNETLRLTLAQQESGFIAEKLVLAKRRLRRRLLYLCAAVVLMAGIVIYLVAAASGASVRLETVHGALSLIFIAAGTIAFLNLVLLPFAWMELDKYKLYEKDHEAFLARYGREKP